MVAFLIIAIDCQEGKAATEFFLYNFQARILCFLVGCEVVG